MVQISSFGHSVLAPRKLIFLVVQVGHVYSSLGTKRFCDRRAYPHNAHSSRRFQLCRLDKGGRQKLREQEWRDAIRSQLEFISLLRLAPLRRNHNARIVP